MLEYNVYEELICSKQNEFLLYESPGHTELIKLIDAKLQLSQVTCEKALEILEIWDLDIDEAKDFLESVVYELQTLQWKRPLNNFLPES